MEVTVLVAVHSPVLNLLWYVLKTLAVGLWEKVAEVTFVVVLIQHVVEVTVKILVLDAAFQTMQWDAEMWTLDAAALAQKVTVQYAKATDAVNR